MNRAFATSIDAPERERFASDVAESLQRRPRELPSKYLYDALGSTLFEAICRLPWYRVTRAESSLLAQYGRKILEPMPRPYAIAELGCGSGEKLALLLERAGDGCAQVQLVDISGEALQRASDRLEHLPLPAVIPHEARYEEGLGCVAARRPEGVPLVVLFLGSNLGNFDPEGAHALLARIRDTLRPGDAFLLGADLVKPERDLLLAYDDPLQVTAAFNRNLLRRINDELGGTFDLDGFTHRAVWNARQSRVEMHLVSRGRQWVRIEAADLELAFEPDEWIWTESSYKYDPGQIVSQGLAAGFRPGAQWIEPAARFALTLFRV